jgi:hypothetical protein
LQILPFEFDFAGSTADEVDVELEKISFLGDGEDNPGIVLDNNMLTIPSSVKRVDVRLPVFDDDLVEEKEDLALVVGGKKIRAKIYDNDFISIDGSNRDCADNEYFFEANGKPGGVVSFGLTLVEKFLPLESQVFYSQDQANWTPYDINSLTRLSDEGDKGFGYLKVLMGKQPAEIMSLDAQVTQYDIQLEANIPIIDLQYQMLHFDGAVPQADAIWSDDGAWPGGKLLNATDSWTEVAAGTRVENAYRYTNLLPTLRNRLGYRLQADVSLEFNTFLKKFTFDTDQQLDDPSAGDFDYANRFQPRFGDGKDTKQGPQDVSFDFDFYLLNEESGKRQKVALKNFWVDVVDLDTPHDNPNHEFVSIPGLDLASNEDENSSAAIIYTFPDGDRNPGEQGFVDGQKTNGSKNLIKVVEDSGHTKFLGSSKWNVFHGQKFNEYKFSNHPAGSVLLDYREPVKNLIFNAGTTGKMHSGANPLDNKGKPKVGGSRNLSFSIGNSFTSGDGFKPTGDIQQDSASILLEDCDPDILGDVLSVTPEAVCLDDDNNKLATFTYMVNVEESNIDQDYEYAFSSKKVGEYVVLGSSINGAGSEDIAQQNKNGLITVEKGATKFVVTVDVQAEDRLGKNDELTLTVKSTDSSNDEAGQFGTASLKDQQLLDCDPDILGDVLSVTPEAVCLDDDNNKLATFTYMVNVEESNIDQDYEYAFSSKKVGEYVVLGSSINGAGSEDIAQQNKNGLITVEKGATKFVVTVDVQAEDRLGKNDELTLTVKSTDSSNDEAGQFGTASLKDQQLLDCDPDILGDVLSVTPEAVCLDDDNNKLATFTYMVNVEESNIDQDYEYAFSSKKVGEYVVLGSSINGAGSEDIAQQNKNGLITVEKGATKFVVTVDVQAEDRLGKNDELTLTVKSTDSSNDEAGQFGTASLKDQQLLDCDPDILGDVLSVTPEAVCLDDDNNKLATFTYMVNVEESNIDQDYEYAFSSKKVGEYVVLGSSINGAGSEDIAQQNKNGLITVEKGATKFVVTVDVQAEDRLGKNDELTLTVKSTDSSNDEAGQFGTASLKDQQLLDCDPDILGDVLSVTPEAVCLDDDNNKLATFTYMVNVEESNIDQDYEYAFSSKKVGEYVVLGSSINGAGSEDIAQQNKNGLITVEKGATKFVVTVDVQAEDRLGKNDELTLTVKSTDSSNDEAGQFGTASLKDQQLLDCDPDILGDVLSVTPEAVCLDDDNNKLATFTYMVNVEESNIDQDYEYAFSSKKVGEYVVLGSSINGAGSEDIAQQNKNGLITVEKGATKFVVTVDVQAEDRLGKNDELTLTVKSTDSSNDEAGQFGTASLKDQQLLDCDPDILGDVLSVTPEAVCLDDDNNKLATFTYMVNVEESNIDQDYEYAFSSKKVGEYVVLGSSINGAGSEDIAQQNKNGLITVEKGATKFVVTVDVQAEDRLGKNDELTLTVKSTDSSNDEAGQFGTASLKDQQLLDCDPDILGDVLSVTPEAVCLDDDNNKLATFTYMVNVEESNIDQDYEYAFSSKKVGEYVVLGSSINGAGSEDIAQQNKNGLITVEKGATKFVVTVDVQAEDRLGKNDELTLTVKSTDSSNDEAGQFGTASLKDQQLLDCDPDILGDVERINAAGACVESSNAKIARFAFDVDLKGPASNDSQEYFYKFASNKFLGDGYEIDQVLVNGERRDLDAEGQFTVPQAGVVSDFSVQVQISADAVLDGSEALMLRLDNQPDLSGKSPSATAKIKNFDDCGIPGSVQSITPSGACVDDGDVTKATFAFLAKLDSGYNNRGQVFSYRFDANKALADGYDVTAFVVNGEKQNVPAKQGSFEISSNSFKAVSDLEIQVDVQAGWSVGWHRIALVDPRQHCYPCRPDEGFTQCEGCDRKLR